MHKHPELDQRTAVTTPDVPALRRAAMDYLARREHSLHELKTKLGSWFPETDSEIIQTVLEKLRSDGLQSDDRFAESYTRYRRSRGFGPRHIENELRRRKTNEQSIIAHIKCDEAVWYDTIRTLIRKKNVNAVVNEHSDEEKKLENKQYRRLTRFLESRGFTPDQIRRALTAEFTIK